MATVSNSAKRRGTRWQDVYDAIKNRIETRQLSEGELFGSEHELKTEFNVSRGTVRRALSQLLRDGYVQLRAGQRREVRLPPPIRYTRLGMNDATVVPSFGEHLCKIAGEEHWPQNEWPEDMVIDRPKHVLWYNFTHERRMTPGMFRQAIGCQGDEEVIWFMRVRCARKTPLALQWAAIPAELVPQVSMEDLHPGGLTALYHRSGIVRHSFESTFSPTVASSEEARLLRIERGTPLLEEHRVSYYVSAEKDGAPRPFELLVTLYTNRISLAFRWSDRSAGVSAAGAAGSKPPSEGGSGRHVPVRGKSVAR